MVREQGRVRGLGVVGTASLGMATRAEEGKQTVSVGWVGYCLTGHSCSLVVSQQSSHTGSALGGQTPVIIALALAYLG